MSSNTLIPLSESMAYLEAVRAKVVSSEVMQHQPWTAVRVKAKRRGKLYTEHGFSKASYPDRWCPEVGVGVAVQRALSLIVLEMDNDVRVKRCHKARG
jgi:hypothetical protein